MKKLFVLGMALFFVYFLYEIRGNKREIRGTDTHFFEVKTVKRIFLLEKMNSGEGVPGQ
jgi:hypothetical protein